MKAIVTGSGCGAASCGGSRGTFTPRESVRVLRFRMGEFRTWKAEQEGGRGA
jgi:hypothetical protein